MKKRFTACVLGIVILILSGCSAQSVEKPLVLYNGRYYNSYISEDYTYSSFWYPLNEADITDTAYYCGKGEDTEKLGKDDETPIKRFSDKGLKMFVCVSDFNGEWLYLDTQYTLPSVSGENIEEAVIIGDSSESPAELYNQNRCISIRDADKIACVAERFNELNGGGEPKAYEFKEIENPAELYIKFKDINALYYLCLVGKADLNTVFYNAHGKLDGFYTMYEQDKSNPFGEWLNMQ